MEWYIECLIGIVLGIYATSRKVREVVNHYVFRRNRQPDYADLIRDAEKEATAPPDFKINEDGIVEMDAAQYAELIKKYPDLKVSRRQ